MYQSYFFNSMNASHIGEKMHSMFRRFCKMFLLMVIIKKTVMESTLKNTLSRNFELGCVFFFLSSIAKILSVYLNTCPCSVSFSSPEFDHLLDSSFTCSHHMSLLSYSYLSFVVGYVHFLLFLCLTSCLVLNFNNNLSNSCYFMSKEHNI